MPKVVRVSRLKGIRERFQMSTEELAERLGVALMEVKRWEKDLSEASSAQLRDLAVVLGVPVQSLTGEEAEGAATSKWAFDRELGTAYGTLRLTFGMATVEYPIDEDERISVLQQLYERGPQEEGCAGAWLRFGSLDNLIVFANPAYLHGIELLSDDAEQMPDFEHPEVYQAIETWDCGREECGPVLTARCEELLDADEDAITRSRHLRILSETGGESWSDMVDPGDIDGVFELDLVADLELPPNRFMRTSVEGYYVERFVNLSKTALIEVPANKYLKLGMEE